MLGHAGANGEDVGVNDDVFRREVQPVGEDAITAFGDFNPPCHGIGLAGFVKTHDDDGCTHVPADLRPAYKFIFTVLE
ncbi:MAG: hypothetical protein OKBPIBMD_02144 [Chlorobi bacterium]|nr:hypothetical protein [Chlorobiota bacterium]